MEKVYKASFILIIVITSLFAQSKQVGGKVIEIETNKPIEGCIVLLSELDKEITSLAITDSSGNFFFDNISGKFVQISIEKITYDGAILGPIRLKKNTPTKLKVILTPVPHYTDDVIVTSEKDKKILQTAGFYERKQNGNGQFLTLNDFKKYEITSIRQLILNFTQLAINQNGQVFNRYARVGINGTSTVTIIVDGIRYDQGCDTSPLPIEAIVSIDSVIGIEFYKNSAEIPSQYSQFNTAAGVLLIWTK
ncbi:MAG: hypothetical protein ACEPO8_07250 [Rhodothermaceae bacterium]